LIFLFQNSLTRFSHSSLQSAYPAHAKISLNAAEKFQQLLYLGDIYPNFYSLPLAEITVYQLPESHFE